MALEFEWDSDKAEANRRKHGVAFDEASSGTLLVVSHVERGGRIRLISARRANRREQRDYEESPE